MVLVFGIQIQTLIIGTKSMQNNISIRRVRTSGNPEVSQTHLAISITYCVQKIIIIIIIIIIISILISIILVAK